MSMKVSCTHSLSLTHFFPSPLIAAYAHEPTWYVIGRAVEHAQLTHKSITVTACLASLVPLLHNLWRGMPLRMALETCMAQLHPPKITGRQMRDSYVNHQGPGNIPKDEKWKQHMELDLSITTMELVQNMLDNGDDDQDVAGWGDRDHSRLSTACYCEHAYTIVLYLAYKYHDTMSEALLQNARLGGHSTARGAVLGAIMGAAATAAEDGGAVDTRRAGEAIPFVNDLCAKSTIDEEIANLVATLP